MSDADIAAAGRRGAALLEQFETSGDPRDLAEAVRLLAGAVADSPASAELIWRYGLGLGHFYQAQYAPPSTDPGQIDELLTELVRVLDDCDDDEIGCELVEMVCDVVSWRFDQAMADGDGDVRTATDWAQASIEALGAERLDGPAGCRARALLGLVHFELGRSPLAPSELARAATLLADALPALALDTPGLPYLWSSLSDTAGLLADEADGRHRRAELELAVDAAQRAREAARTVGGSDLEYRVQEGYCRCRLWDLHADPDDPELDRAIECWDPILLSMSGPDRLSWADLMITRGNARQGWDDLDRVVTILRQLVAGRSIPEPDRSVAAAALAELLRDRWQRTNLRSDLVEQVDLVQISLAVEGISTSSRADLQVRRAEAVVRLTEVDGSPEELIRRSAREIELAVDLVIELAEENEELGGLLATGLMSTVCSLLSIDLSVLDLSRLRELSRLSRTGPAEVTGVAAMLAGLIDLADGVWHRNDQGFGIEAMLEGVRSAGFPETLQGETSLLMTMALMSRGLLTGDRAALEGARSLATVAAGSDDRDVAADARVMEAILGLFEEMTSSLIPFGQTASSGLPASALEDRMRCAVEAIEAAGDRPSAAVMAPLLSMIAASVGLPGPVNVARAGAQVGGTAAALSREVTRVTADIGALNLVFSSDDPYELRLAAASMAAIAERAGAGHPFWPMYCHAAATGYLRAARQGDLRAIDPARTWLERARSAADERNPGRCAELEVALAEIGRISGGDPAESRRLAFEGLLSYQHQALLQSGADHAVASARDVGRITRQIADWCQADGEYADEVRALEAGRGLALHATLADRMVDELLRTNGDCDLADRWLAANGNTEQTLPLGSMIPDSLRLQVISRLRGTALGQLLAPPEIADLQRGLRQSGWQALIYLIPGGTHGLGRAVVVCESGPVRAVELPGLAVSKDSIPNQFLRLLGSDRPGPVEEIEFAATVEQVCDWIGDTVGCWLAEFAARHWPGVVSQIGLVPVGELAALPWSGARIVRGNGPRYLIESVAVSVVATARLFCRNLNRARSAEYESAPGLGVTIVADPAGDLEAARVEAVSIRDSFYPHGILLGRIPSPDGDNWPAPNGIGTADQLLAAIDSGGAADSLHLACHAVADAVRPERSKLLLANGESLQLREVVNRRRLVGFRLGRVFLSACSTARPGEVPDELFSLAAAFLVAGASTVVGSMWLVSDRETAVLMYRLHQEILRGLPPLLALREAQLWMLSGASDDSAPLPSSLLARVDESRIRHPQAWAAFVHLGQ